MKKTYVVILMVVAIGLFVGMAWWGFQPVKVAVPSDNMAQVNANSSTTVTAGLNINTNETLNTNATINANTAADVNTTTNTNKATNTSSETNTNKSTNTNTPSNTNTTTPTTKAGSVPTFFASTATAWRPATKTNKMLNGRTLTEYAYRLPLGSISGSHISYAPTGGVTMASATKIAVAETAQAVSADEWKGHVPSGHAFLKVNWFCSAALTHLTNVTGGQSQTVGDFTGDCTNSNVSVKGNFMPLQLGEFSPSKELNFHIASEHQSLGNTSYDTNGSSKCVIDRIQNAGTVGVFAVQYTCDDGYSVGGDDIQFTVYVFPNNWTSPSEPLDLLITADKNSDDDGDSLTYVQEVSYKTNPNNSDTDYDGLGDFEEINKYKTDPNKADTDGDGVKDGAEVAASQNPLGAGAATAEQLAAWGVAPSQPGKTTISEITTTYAAGRVTVGWKVSPNADGIVNWGATADYGQHLSDYALSASHSINFAVASGSTIHYAIRSCTPAPNSVCTVSADLTYTAP